MLRRTSRALNGANPFTNVVGESLSFRAVPMRSGLQDVQDSPYKETFKEFWSKPVPWGKREYGPKPKIGDPIPLRRATSMVVCAKNHHNDPSRISSGEDNDYKVLMMHRQGKGRFTKDECVLPAATYDRADWDDAWDKVLKRLGMTSEFEDVYLRLSAMRGLLTEDNMLVLPKEHGGMAEVQGPPGPKKWHMLINSSPEAFRTLVDILELPMEPIMNRLKPFRRVQTPETEMFRFDNHCYAVTLDKVPCVKYTVSVTGEKLFWVSPKEALARVNAGLMEMPTPNIVLLSELANEYPKFADVDSLNVRNEPKVILPELVYKKDNMSTILLPGDMSHSKTKQEDIDKNMFRRIEYTKGQYFGSVPAFTERVADEEDDVTILKRAEPRMIEEINEFDRIYEEVEEPVRKVAPKDNMKMRMAPAEFQMRDVDLVADDVEVLRQEEDRKFHQLREAAGLFAGSEKQKKLKSEAELRDEEDKLRLKMINAAGGAANQNQ